MFTSDVFSPSAVSLVWLLRLLLCCWLQPGQVETAALSAALACVASFRRPRPRSLLILSRVVCQYRGRSRLSTRLSALGPAVVIAVTTTTTTHGTGELATACSLLLSPQFLPRLPPTGPQHTTDTQHSLLTRIIHPTDGFNFNVILRSNGSVLRNSRNACTR